MTERSRSLRLEGLESHNLLAFLALLGLLRSLEAARPAWRVRAAWQVGSPPLRPVLILAKAEDAETICEAAAEGATMLANDYNFPQNEEDGAEPQTDLNYEAEKARRLLDKVTKGRGPRCAELWSALMCDAAEKDGKIEATPLCLLFGQGHQHFLDRLATVPRTEAPPPRGRGKKAVTLTAAQTLYEALFEPWTRQDPTPAFRWDPAEDVRYALRADDPSGQKSTTQHGANRLAALGFAVLTATPVQRGVRVRLQVVGGSFERDGFVFCWPIWKDPTSLAGIKALLSHPDLRSGASALTHLGVLQVLSTRRIGVGKFMNFTRAEPVDVIPAPASLRPH
jgi:hypothetical protein